MDTFISHLPEYHLMWPCERYAALDQFGWFLHADSDRIHLYGARGRLSALGDDVRQRYSQAPAQLPRSNKSSSVLMVDSMAYFTDPAAPQICVTHLLFNAILPLVEYLVGTKEFDWFHIRRSGNRTKAQKRRETRDVMHVNAITYQHKKADVVVLREASRWELLSHEQPADTLSGVGVTLWNSLSDAFDMPTILLAVAGLLLPVCLILLIQFGVMMNSTQPTLRLIRIVAFDALRHLIDSFALLLGDADHLIDNLYDPTLKRARNWITRLSLTWWFTFGCLTTSLFYDKLFDINLLDKLINEQTALLETFSQFVPRMSPLNLTFVSVQTPIKSRTIKRFKNRESGLSATDEGLIKTLANSGTERVIRSDDRRQLFAAIRPRNVIVNTQNLGCDALRLTDPLWKSRKYHCYRGYAMKSSQVFLLNRQTRAHLKIKRLARGIVEGELERRITSSHRDLYHLASMDAARFEPHEEHALRQLSLRAVQRLFIDAAVMLAIILCGSLLIHTTNTCIPKVKIKLGKWLTRRKKKKTIKASSIDARPADEDKSRTRVIHTVIYRNVRVTPE